MTPQEISPPEIGQAGASVQDAGAKSAALSGQYVCPECLARFKPKASRQLFCCADHKREWHNRAAKRGAVLFSLVMARIVDCVEAMESRWFYGRYGFVLADAFPVELIPCRGQLGFFLPPLDALIALSDALRAFAPLREPEGGAA